MVRFHSNSLWTIVLLEREARQIDGHTHKIDTQTQTAGEGEERKGGRRERECERSETDKHKHGRTDRRRHFTQLGYL